jgi:5-methylcytosine-specific restriction endonuclease McrA
MKGFSKEVREAVVRSQHGYCDLCANKERLEVHHRVPNTKTNNKLFPLFLHSIFNAIALCYGCHTYKKHEYNISLDKAREYEEYLRGLKPGETYTK